MDGRNLKKTHKTGERLSHSWVNAVSQQLGIRPSHVNGFESSRSDSSREYIREASIAIETEDDIPAYSVFSAVGRTGNNIIPVFKAMEKGWGVWTNGPYELKADTKGTVSPLSFHVPALVKQTTDTDYQPKAGDICGVSDEFTATRKRGGLLCLGGDGNDELVWVVRFEGPIHALAVAVDNVGKRAFGDFKVLGEDTNEFFPTGKYVKAFNIHNAGIATTNHVILSFSLGHGVSATKWNGGMWLGVTDTSITGGSYGNVTLDDTGETIEVLAPPDGLGEGKKVNCIEYEFDGFHAYQIEC